jgi:hypothetical protein
MAHTIEVEIDDLGGIHPLQTDAKLPPGRAFDLASLRGITRVSSF